MEALEREFIDPAAAVCRRWMIVVAQLLVSMNCYAQWQLVHNLERPPSAIRFNKYGVGFAGGITISVPIDYTANSGIWRSSDSGRSWTACVVTLDPKFRAWSYHPIIPEDFTFRDSLTGWVACPANNDNLYRGGSILKTTDGGVTWSSVYFDPDVRPWALYYSSNSESLFAATRWGDVVMVSSDEGITWKDATGIRPYTIAVHSFISNDPYVVCSTVQLNSGPWLRSTNSGSTWEEFGFGPMGDSFIESWQPYWDRSSNVVYAVLDGGGWNHPAFPLYASTDFGTSWQPRHTFLPTTSDGYGVTGCIAGDGNGAVYLQDMTEGILMSRDSGANWRSLCGPSTWIDTKFDVIGPYVLASDYSGGLWRLDTRETAGISLADSVRLTIFGCHVREVIPFSGWSVCGNGVTLDSFSVEGSSYVSVDAGALPRPVLGKDSILVAIESGKASDTTIVRLHFTLMGKRADTTLTVTAHADAAAAQLKLESVEGAHTIVTMAGIEQIASVRLRADVMQSSMLDEVSCHVTLPNSISKSGPSIGVNGWIVTNDVLNGSDLTLEVSRTALVNLHAGDEIVRIPIEAYVTVDTSAAVVLKDYSFNSDFKGCAPEAITPDTVMITISQECGDRTLREYMRGEALAIESVSPNPASKTIEVKLRGGKHLAVLDVLGREIYAVIPSAQESLDVSRMSSGTYYLRVTGQGGIRTARIVVRR